MKIVIDTDSGKLMVAGPQGVKELELSSPVGGKLLSQLAQASQDLPASDASFTWGGHAVQEHPDVLFRLQEAVHQVRPDILVHIGKTAAGSLLYLAHVLQTFGGEQVWSVDGGIPLDDQLSAAKIQFINGDATGWDAFPQDRSDIPRMLILLKESRGKTDLLAKLETYSARLPMGSAFLSMELLSVGELRAKHAAEAFAEFAMDHPEYRGEFLSGRTGAGLVPLLIRMRA